MIIVGIVLILCSLLAYVAYLDTLYNCKHNWEILESTEMKDSRHAIVGSKHVQCCKLCGELKQNIFMNPRD